LCKYKACDSPAIYWLPDGGIASSGFRRLSLVLCPIHLALVLPPFCVCCIDLSPKRAVLLWLFVISSSIFRPSSSNITVCLSPFAILRTFTCPLSISVSALSCFDPLNRAISTYLLVCLPQQPNLYPSLPNLKQPRYPPYKDHSVILALTRATHDRYPILCSHPLGFKYVAADSKHCV
jgi:hypothetical protein